MILSSKPSALALAAACLLYVLSITPIMIEMFIAFQIKDKIKSREKEEKSKIGVGKEISL
jgi:hypothetical protein